MSVIRRYQSVVFSLLFLAGLSPAKAQEGWYADGPPQWVQTEFKTVGGITYFEHVSHVPLCGRINAEPVSRVGTNLAQFITQERWFGNCPYQYCESDCYYYSTNVSILGALPAGDYTMTFYKRNNPFDPAFPNMPFAQAAFSVPGSAAGTQTISANRNGTDLSIGVGGVPHVKYVIESSTDMTNWTAIATNIGPFTYVDSNLSTGTNRFYRTLILSPD
jgi:hypothetical protein